MPEAFFKYMSYSTARTVLENQTLRWTTPATLNDPYDIQFDLRVDFNREQALIDSVNKLWKVFKGDLACNQNSEMYPAMEMIRSLCAEIPKPTFFDYMSNGVNESFATLDRAVAEAHKATRLQLSTMKVLCLTDSPTNQLMWAHYADSNKGIVLRFQQEHGADSPYSQARAINYRQTLPMLFTEEEVSDFLSGLTIFDAQPRIDNLIYTKSDVWAYEKEWRICSGKGRNTCAPHEDLKFGSRELTGIIFGCRIPIEHKLSLLQIIRDAYPHVEVLEAVTANHTYQLELNQYTAP